MKTDICEPLPMTPRVSEPTRLLNELNNSLQENGEDGGKVRTKPEPPPRRDLPKPTRPMPYDPTKFENKFHPENFEGVIIEDEPQVWNIINKGDEDPATVEHWTENQEPQEGKAFFSIDNRGRSMEDIKSAGQYPPFVLEFPQHFDGITPKPVPSTPPWHLRVYGWAQRGLYLCQKTFHNWFHKQQPKEESHTKE